MENLTEEQLKIRKLRKEGAERKRKVRWERIGKFRYVIEDFTRMGFEVKEVAPAQFRFNETIDIMPSTRRYHDLINNINGDIRGKDLGQFLREWFKLN
jgi:hypothetical protein